MELAKQTESFIKLNFLEQQLIALCLPFEKLCTLALSFQNKIQGPVICVQPSLATVTNVLPRPLGHSKITAVKLKRKFIYRGHVDFQEIDSIKVAKTLTELQRVNPFYKSVEVNPN